MRDCAECKFEEFFLTSWAVGDPAMVVDVPANSPCNDRQARSATRHPARRRPDRKATKAFYPDDPSNVYHSYMGDHTKFRVLHAGSKEHHIHHLHAHQWLYSPDNDKSSYLDSQAIGPGARSPPRSPMAAAATATRRWATRSSTAISIPTSRRGCGRSGACTTCSRRAPSWTRTASPRRAPAPCRTARSPPARPSPPSCRFPASPWRRCPAPPPSIVNGQAQVTGAGNPGYPFFVPGTAGHRPPRPPLDTSTTAACRATWSRRHGGPEAHTRLDFHKELLTSRRRAARDRHAVEQQAMAFHATREHPTCRPDGACDGRPGQVPRQRLARGGRRALRRSLLTEATSVNRPLQGGGHPDAT